MELRQEQRIATLEAENAELKRGAHEDGLLRVRYAAQNAELRKELERERIRLAACGSAALGYYEGCKDEYKSASLDDVLRLRKDAERFRFLRDNPDFQIEYTGELTLEQHVEQAMKEAQS